MAPKDGVSVQQNTFVVPDISIKDLLDAIPLVFQRFFRCIELSTLVAVHIASSVLLLDLPHTCASLCPFFLIFSL